MDERIRVTFEGDISPLENDLAQATQDVVKFTRAIDDLRRLPTGPDLAGIEKYQRSLDEAKRRQNDLTQKIADTMRALRDLESIDTVDKLKKHFADLATQAQQTNGAIAKSAEDAAQRIQAAYGKIRYPDASGQTARYGNPSVSRGYDIPAQPIKPPTVDTSAAQKGADDLKKINDGLFSDMIATIDKQGAAYVSGLDRIISQAFSKRVPIAQVFADDEAKRAMDASLRDFDLRLRAREQFLRQEATREKQIYQQMANEARAHATGVSPIPSSPAFQKQANVAQALTDAGKAAKEAEANVYSANRAIAAMEIALSRVSAPAGAWASSLRTLGFHLDATTQAAIAAGVVIAGFGAGILVAFSGALRAANDFDKAIGVIRAIAGEKTFAPLEAQVRQVANTLGKDTVFSSVEAAQAIGQLVKSGIPLQQALDTAAKSALGLAAATGEDVVTAATNAASVMRIFQDQVASGALTFEKVADVMTASVSAAGIEMTTFRNAMEQVGPTADLMGQKFEATAAAIDVLARTGIQGEKAGTALNTMLLNLAPTNARAYTAMALLGTTVGNASESFYDAQGRMKSFADITDILTKHTANLDDVQKQQIFTMLFGHEGMRAAIDLTKQGGDAVRAMQDRITESGAAQAAMNARLQGLYGATELFKSSVESLAVNIGGALTPVLVPFISVLTQVLNAFISLPDSVQAVIVITMAASAAVLLLTGSAAALAIVLARVNLNAAGVGSFFRAMRTEAQATTASMLHLAAAQTAVAATGGRGAAAGAAAGGARQLGLFGGTGAAATTVAAQNATAFETVGATIGRLIVPLGVAGAALGTFFALYASNLGGFQEKTNTTVSAVALEWHWFATQVGSGLADAGDAIDKFWHDHSGFHTPEGAQPGSPAANLGEWIEAHGVAAIRRSMENSQNAQLHRSQVETDRAHAAEAERLRGLGEGVTIDDRGYADVVVARLDSAVQRVAAEVRGGLPAQASLDAALRDQIVNVEGITDGPEFNEHFERLKNQVVDRMKIVAPDVAREVTGVVATAQEAAEQEIIRKGAQLDSRIEDLILKTKGRGATADILIGAEVGNVYGTAAQARGPAAASEEALTAGNEIAQRFAQRNAWQKLIQEASPAEQAQFELTRVEHGNEVIATLTSMYEKLGLAKDDAAKMGRAENDMHAATIKMMTDESTAANANILQWMEMNKARQAFITQSATLTADPKLRAMLADMARNPENLKPGSLAIEEISKRTGIAVAKIEADLAHGLTVQQIVGTLDLATRHATGTVETAPNAAEGGRVLGEQYREQFVKSFAGNLPHDVGAAFVQGMGNLQQDIPIERMYEEATKRLGIAQDVAKRAAEGYRGAIDQVTFAQERANRIGEEAALQTRALAQHEDAAVAAMTSGMTPAMQAHIQSVYISTAATQGQAAALRAAAEAAGVDAAALANVANMTGAQATRYLDYLKLHSEYTSQADLATDKLAGRQRGFVQTIVSDVGPALAAEIDYLGRQMPDAAQAAIMAADKLRISHEMASAAIQGSKLAMQEVQAATAAQQYRETTPQPVAMEALLHERQRSYTSDLIGNMKGVLGDAMRDFASRTSDPMDVFREIARRTGIEVGTLTSAMNGNELAAYRVERAMKALQLSTSMTRDEFVKLGQLKVVDESIDANIGKLPVMLRSAIDWIHQTQGAMAAMNEITRMTGISLDTQAKAAAGDALAVYQLGQAMDQLNFRATNTVATFTQLQEHSRADQLFSTLNEKLPPVVRDFLEFEKRAFGAGISLQHLADIAGITSEGLRASMDGNKIAMQEVQEHVEQLSAAMNTSFNDYLFQAMKNAATQMVGTFNDLPPSLMAAIEYLKATGGSMEALRQTSMAFGVSWQGVVRDLRAGNVANSELAERIKNVTSAMTAQEHAAKEGGDRVKSLFDQVKQAMSIFGAANLEALSEQYGGGARGQLAALQQTGRAARIPDQNISAALSTPASHLPENFIENMAEQMASWSAGPRYNISAMRRQLPSITDPAQRAEWQSIIAESMRSGGYPSLQRFPTVDTPYQREIARRTGETKAAFGDNMTRGYEADVAKDVADVKTQLQLTDTQRQSLAQAQQANDPTSLLTNISNEQLNVQQAMLEQLQILTGHAGGSRPAGGTTGANGGAGGANISGNVAGKGGGTPLYAIGPGGYPGGYLGPIPAEDGRLAAPSTTPATGVEPPFARPGNYPPAPIEPPFARPGNYPIPRDTMPLQAAQAAGIPILRGLQGTGGLPVAPVATGGLPGLTSTAPARLPTLPPLLPPEMVPTPAPPAPPPIEMPPPPVTAATEASPAEVEAPFAQPGNYPTPATPVVPPLQPASVGDITLVPPTPGQPIEPIVPPPPPGVTHITPQGIGDAFDAAGRGVRNILPGLPRMPWDQAPEEPPQGQVSGGMRLLSSETSAGTAAGMAGLSPGLNQLDAPLPFSEAINICGPTAAAWFVHQFGRNPTVVQAYRMAQTNQHFAHGEMQGPAHEAALLRDLGVQTETQITDPRMAAEFNRMGLANQVVPQLDWARARGEVQAGRPVIADTPGHYFQLTGFNEQTGAFNFGASTRALRSANTLGNEMRPEDIYRYGMGAPRALIFPSQAETSVNEVVGRTSAALLGTAAPATAEVPTGTNQLTGSTRQQITQMALQQFGPEGATVVQALLGAEGGEGMGDKGTSFGPFQFHLGGHLNEYAGSPGVPRDPMAAGQYAQQHPIDAARWAFNNYLGTNIRTGLQHGATGRELLDWSLAGVRNVSGGQNFNAYANQGGSIYQSYLANLGQVQAGGLNVGPGTVAAPAPAPAAPIAAAATGGARVGGGGGGGGSSVAGVPGAVNISRFLPPGMRFATAEEAEAARVARATQLSAAVAERYGITGPLPEGQVQRPELPQGTLPPGAISYQGQAYGTIGEALAAAGIRGTGDATTAPQGAGTLGQALGVTPQVATVTPEQAAANRATDTAAFQASAVRQQRAGATVARMEAEDQQAAAAQKEARSQYGLELLPQGLQQVPGSRDIPDLLRHIAEILTELLREYAIVNAKTVEAFEKSKEAEAAKAQSDRAAGRGGDGGVGKPMDYIGSPRDVPKGAGASLPDSIPADALGSMIGDEEGSYGLLAARGASGGGGGGGGTRGGAGTGTGTGTRGGGAGRGQPIYGPNGLPLPQQPGIQAPYAAPTGYNPSVPYNGLPGVPGTLGGGINGPVPVTFVGPNGEPMSNDPYHLPQPIPGEFNFPAPEGGPMPPRGMPPIESGEVPGMTYDLDALGGPLPAPPPGSLPPMLPLGPKPGPVLKPIPELKHTFEQTGGARGSGTEHISTSDDRFMGYDKEGNPIVKTETREMENATSTLSSVLKRQVDDAAATMSDIGKVYKTHTEKVNGVVVNFEDSINQDMTQTVKIMDANWKNLWEVLIPQSTNGYGMRENMESYQAWQQGKHYAGGTPDANRLGMGPGFAGPAPAMPQYATGGLITSPQVATIGENGPEAIIPLKQGADAAYRQLSNYLQQLAGPGNDAVTSALSDTSSPAAQAIASTNATSTSATPGAPGATPRVSTGTTAAVPTGNTATVPAGNMVTRQPTYDEAVDSLPQHVAEQAASWGVSADDVMPLARRMLDQTYGRSSPVPAVLGGNQFDDTWYRPDDFPLNPTFTSGSPGNIVAPINGSTNFVYPNGMPAFPPGASPDGDAPTPFAEGGLVRQRTLALMGEAGPEARINLGGLLRPLLEEEGGHATEEHAATTAEHTGEAVEHGPAPSGVDVTTMRPDNPYLRSEEFWERSEQPGTAEWLRRHTAMHEMASPETMEHDEWIEAINRTNEETERALASQPPDPSLGLYGPTTISSAPSGMRIMTPQMEADLNEPSGSRREFMPNPLEAPLAALHALPIGTLGAVSGGGEEAMAEATADALSPLTMGKDVLPALGDLIPAIPEAVNVTGRAATEYVATRAGDAAQATGMLASGVGSGVQAGLSNLAQMVGLGQPAAAEDPVGASATGVMQIDPHVEQVDEVPQFASGGIVTSPTIAMVGERGPEAIVPLGGMGMDPGAGSLADAVDPNNLFIPGGGGGGSRGGGGVSAPVGMYGPRNLPNGGMIYADAFARGGDAGGGSMTMQADSTPLNASAARNAGDSDLSAGAARGSMDASIHIGSYNSYGNGLQELRTSQSAKLRALRNR